jgi:hypothetical protein
MTTSDEPERDVAQRAERFKRVRDAHQTEMAEGYLELIADLIDAKGEARMVDLAARLGASRPTVNGAIQRLQRDGLVSSEPYRSMFLTEKGRGLAVWCAGSSSPWAWTPRRRMPMRRGSSITSARPLSKRFAGISPNPAEPSGSGGIDA